jgi:uncharacterized protein YchJ
MKHIFTLYFLLSITYVQGQSINPNWQQDLNTSLEELKQCENTNHTGVSSCNQYMGNALKQIYKIDDFYSTPDERHMLAHEIAEFLKNSESWTLLGYGFEQKALTEAQRLANDNKAVVAAYVNEEGLGHVAYIVPGEVRLSGIWGIQVPNSASLFPSDPTKSYVSKPLSYSFEGTQVKRVLIYARNY